VCQFEPSLPDLSIPETAANMLLSLRAVLTCRIYRLPQLTIVLAISDDISERCDATMLKVSKEGVRAGLAQGSLSHEQRRKLRRDLELVIAELDQAGETVVAAHVQMAADLLKAHDPAGQRSR